MSMVMQVSVVIVAAPIACGPGVRDTWRQLSSWVAGQLQHAYGETVDVQYFDIFEAGCPPLPPDAGELPLVLVDGRMVSSGGKLSVPLIRRAVEAAHDRCHDRAGEAGEESEGGFGGQGDLTKDPRP